MATWGQLGVHRKPVGVLNIEGFWDPFLAQLDRCVNGAAQSGRLSCGPARTLSTFALRAWIVSCARMPCAMRIALYTYRVAPGWTMQWRMLTINNGSRCPYMENMQDGTRRVPCAGIQGLAVRIRRPRAPARCHARQNARKGLLCVGASPIVEDPFALALRVRTGQTVVCRVRRGGSGVQFLRWVRCAGQRVRLCIRHCA